MAGINEYRQAGFFYEADPARHLHHGPSASGDDYSAPPVPSSGRVSARGDYYYGAGPGGSGSRAISPYSVGSPRFGYPASGYTLIDGSDDPSIQTVAAKGAGLLAIVVENLISHPFLVLRRQCQVHTASKRYHIFPLTMISPVFYICQRQGVAVLWKGLGSTLVVRGMGLAVEDLTSKLTPCPKEISRHSSTKAVVQHLLLKALSLAVITPFYSASLVETVQSDVASETAGFFDVFKEGLWRLLAWPSTGRLVPLHVLIVPTVAHGLLSYLIYKGVKSASVSAIRRVRESKERKQGALSRDTSLSYYTELTASLVGNMTADIILFPLETVLNRLHLQGTRTIVDSLENGIEVTPILTSYAGVLDCLRSTVDDEGFAGLYKGFGALVLQYGLQILIIRTMKIVLENSPFGLGSGRNSSGAPSPGSTTPPLVLAGGGVSEPKLASAGYVTPSAVHQSRSEPSSFSRTTPAGQLQLQRDEYEGTRSRSRPFYSPNAAR